VQFNEQVAVQHCVLGSPASASGMNPTTSAGNTGGAEPSSSTQGDPMSSHGGAPSSQPLGDANAGNTAAQALLVQTGMTVIREVQIIAMIPKVQLLTEII